MEAREEFRKVRIEAGESRRGYGRRLLGLFNETFPYKDYRTSKTLLNHYKRSVDDCLLYTSPSPRDKRQSRMPSSA